MKNICVSLPEVGRELHAVHHAQTVAQDQQGLAGVEGEAVEAALGAAQNFLGKKKKVKTDIRRRVYDKTWLQMGLYLLTDRSNTTARPSMVTAANTVLE